MHRLAVGRPYHPARRHWPEGPQYNFRAGQHELVLFFEGPTDREVEAVRRGPARFALTELGHQLLLSYRFDLEGRPAVPWSDAPYSWGRVDPAERVPPPPAEETKPELRALLAVILVDAGPGIVRALRACTFSPEFTRALHAAIARQAARPFDAAAADAELAAFYAAHPQAAAVAAAARHQTEGGG